MYREECKLGKGWDDELEPETERKFRRWLDRLPDMKSVTIPRCVTAKDMASAAAIELHHFCDASENAYAAVTYLRVIQANGEIHCAYVYGKARLSPLKGDTIPRLELQAAVLAVENHLTIVEEMRLSCDDVYFWSDSMVVLGWIKSDDAKLPKYIDRRVTSIREASGADQWRHISTDINPADAATRGSCDVTTWLQAPRFLYDVNASITCVSARADNYKVKDDGCTVYGCLSNENNIFDQFLQSLFFTVVVTGKQNPVLRPK